MRSTLMLASLVLWSCSGKTGSGASGCDGNSDCPAGAVCSEGACLMLCSNDLSCQSGEACLDGTCKPCSACRQVPDVTGINATGNPDANPANPNRLRQSLVLLGNNLDGIGVTMNGGGFTNTPLLLCGTPTASRAEVELPGTLDLENTYTLTVANQAGTCTTSVQLMRGEIGPAGNYTAGNGIVINTTTLSVDFGPGATQAAPGDHTHSNYLATSGGTLSGDLLLAAGAHLGIGAQSPPALLHVQGSRAANVNSDPTGSMLLLSGMVLSSTTDAIVDDNTSNNAWHTDTATAGAWLRIDLGAGSTREYVQVRIFASSAGYAGRYDVEWSNDATAWTKARIGFSAGAMGWNSAAWPSAGAHRYWRLLLTNTPGAGPWLNELEMYDAGSGPALSVSDDGAVTAARVNALNTAKAWIQFNGATLIIKDSFNVASVARATGNATGVYKITWATPFADTNYAVTGACNSLGFNGAHLSVEDNGSGDTQVTPSSIAIGCRDSANAYQNSDRVYVIAYGR